MYAGPTQEWYVHTVSFPEAGGIGRNSEFSAGRGFTDSCTTLWASWVIRQQALPNTNGGDRTSVYFTG
jgi:hypothetical protein